MSKICEFNSTDKYSNKKEIIAYLDEFLNQCSSKKDTKQVIKYDFTGFVDKFKSTNENDG